MNKLKLAELVELETEMYRRRVAEEIPSLFNFREEQPNLNREYDFDEVKAYFSRKGYSNSEINSVLENYAKMDIDPRSIDIYEIQSKK